MGASISTKTNSIPTHTPNPIRLLLWGALLALVLWVAVDLYVPRKNSLREFNPNEVARLETAMWRSYYQKKPVLLFWQLAGGLRQQFHAPFWRSFILGFQASKAAFDFKKGKSRMEYQKTLPDLISYYESIQALSTEQFNVPNVAKLELEWWIVHRQRERYSYSDLANALVQTSAALYNQPPASFGTYGRLRADAMRLCDDVRQKPGGATEADWQHIEDELNQAWSSFHQAVQRGR
ncbi:hypothetical protein EXU85_05400 [Spirosoma sp. KCTC 42546]|uniref:hypothetical protein n=1 Tax=Spirosoma sp. KCTC 42546 TaxID=2520506 RepID=UPI001157AF18|nr:hypothetical protein [Spirosoma sp. KCTC 42546]QDK78058.1 hypothetical protein EXU85_05400 [Spirosoma sp. KCTC 42546]